MKKYFAKYLPVEGETEEVHFCRACSSLGGGIRHCAHPEECGQIETEKRPKLKLFLCSRDIQVGDTVALIDDYRTTGSVESIDDCEDLHIVWSDCSTSCEHPKNVVKVIGEISPEATWVTEGMEFDKEDLQLNFTDAHGRIIYGASESIQDYRKHNPTYFRVSVKCKCCNTFK